MEPDEISCPRCTALLLYLEAARRPEAVTAGLNEIGLLNRAQQREEKIQRAELAFEKHRKSAHASGQ